MIATMTHDATTRILVVRHGANDPQGRHVLHSCTGLTPAGTVQAEKVANQLRTTLGLGAVDAVLSSRAARTIETATAIAETFGIPIASSTCDLCEMHPGQAEGLTTDEMRGRFGPTYAEVPGGEYFSDWLPGATARLHRIARDHHGQTIVLVTHNGVMKASFAAFGRMPEEEANLIQTANTGVTEWVCSTLLNNPRQDRWSLQRHNDTTHLCSD